MRKRYGIVIGIFACIVVALIFLQIGGKHTYYVSSAVAHNIRSPHAQNGEVYFFSGNTFAKYTIATGKTTTLTKFMSLPKVSKMQISGSGAIFHTDETYVNDDLYYYLSARGLPTDQPYWWAADFKTGTVSLIGEGKPLAREIGGVVWADDSHYLVMAGLQAEDGSLISTDFYKSAGQGLTKVYSVSGEQVDQLVWAKDNQMIIASYDADKKYGVRLIDYANKKETALSNSVGGNIVPNNSGDLVAFQPSTASENLLPEKDATPSVRLYNESKKTVAKLQHNFVGTVNPSRGNGFLVSGRAVGTTKNIYQLVDSKGHHKKLSLRDDPGSLLTLLDFSASDQTHLVAVNNSSLFILSSEKENYPSAPSPTKALAETITNDSFEASYREGSNTIIITVKASPYRKNLEAALAYLRDLDIDTNQSLVSADAIRGVDRAN